MTDAFWAKVEKWGWRAMWVALLVGAAITLADPIADVFGATKNNKVDDGSKEPPTKTETKG